MINSKQKGNRGEREFAKWLRDHNINARRGQQFSGSPESPDIISDLKDFHFEVKRTEKLRIYDAVKQATDDAGMFQTPIVAYRKNRMPWLVIMEAEEWVKYLRN